MSSNRIRTNLLAWYAIHRRRLPWRETSDPYAIWVSEVMLQQTQVATAIPYYQRFMDRFPTPAHLAAADLQQVLKLWEGLGYYARARNLHRAAGQVVSRFEGRVPDDPETFRSLPGVGDYIAAAVLSIAFNRVMPVVDGNVKRVLARLFEMETPVNGANAHAVFREPAMELICHDLPADFNQAIMELGALICRPRNPACAHCPVCHHCLAHRHGTTATYPYRRKSPKVPLRRLAIAVIRKQGKMLVVRRPTEGFLGGLWEFPAVPADGRELNQREIEDRLSAETGLKIEIERPLTRIRHAYTHFKLSADVFLCRCLSGRVRLKSAQGHRWVTLRSLTRLPLHKATHKFMLALTTAIENRPKSG